MARKAGKYGDTRATPYPKVTADRTPKARKPRKLSGKVIGWDVDTVAPNPWLDPAFKLFRDKRYKRFSQD